MKSSSPRAATGAGAAGDEAGRMSPKCLTLGTVCYISAVDSTCLPMLPVQMIETFILTCVALGSAVFILVTVLPSILPRAIQAVRREWGALREVMKDIPPPDSKALGKSVRDIGLRTARLETMVSDIRTVLYLGGASAFFLLCAGILALASFAAVPLVDADGVLYVSTSQTVDRLLLGLSAIGVALMFAFGASSFRIIRLFVKWESQRHGSGRVELGSGK